MSRLEVGNQMLTSSPTCAILTTIDSLLLHKRPENLALKRTQVPQAAQLLRELRIGKSQVHSKEQGENERPKGIKMTIKDS